MWIYVGYPVAPFVYVQCSLRIGPKVSLRHTGILVEKNQDCILHFLTFVETDMRNPYRGPPRLKGTPGTRQSMRLWSRYAELTYIFVHASFRCMRWKRQEGAFPLLRLEEHLGWRRRASRLSSRSLYWNYWRSLGVPFLLVGSTHDSFEASKSSYEGGFTCLIPKAGSKERHAAVSWKKRSKPLRSRESLSLQRGC